MNYDVHKSSLECMDRDIGVIGLDWSCSPLLRAVFVKNMCCREWSEIMNFVLAIVLSTFYIQAAHFDCKSSRLLLGQSFISFVALAGSLPHLTEISNEIKATQKMRKLYGSTVSKVLNLDIKYLVVVMIFLSWINMPLHWWIYQILDYGGKHEGMQHQIPLKNSLRQNSSPKAPLW